MWIMTGHKNNKQKINLSSIFVCCGLAVTACDYSSKTTAQISPKGEVAAQVSSEKDGRQKDSSSFDSNKEIAVSEASTDASGAMGNYGAAQSQSDAAYEQSVATALEAYDDLRPSTDTAGARSPSSVGFFSVGSGTSTSAPQTSSSATSFSALQGTSTVAQPNFGPLPNAGVPLVNASDGTSLLNFTQSLDTSGSPAVTGIDPQAAAAAATSPEIQAVNSTLPADYAITTADVSDAQAAGLVSGDDQTVLSPLVSN